MSLEGTYTYNQLQLGGPYENGYKTVLSGEDLERGAVVGLVTKGAASATADSGNTGSGEFGAITLGSNAIVGDYTLVCTDATTGGSEVFSVHDPNGARLEDLTVGVEYSNNHFTGTLAQDAEGTDFAADDLITISIAAGSGKAKACDITAVDGSQTAWGILVQDCDASSADVTDVCFYTAGKFNVDFLSFGGSTDEDDVEDDLRKRGIYLVDPDDAS